MKPIVLYASRTGNTKKIAEEIASVLGCEALKVGKDNAAVIDLSVYDTVFIGTGITAGTPNKDLVDYLQTAKLDVPTSFVLFMTWGGAGRSNQLVINRIKSVLESRGQSLASDSFACFGGWGLLRRGHPNQQDVLAARNWAKKYAVK